MALLWGGRGFQNHAPWELVAQPTEEQQPLVRLRPEEVETAVRQGGMGSLVKEVPEAEAGQAPALEALAEMDTTVALEVSVTILLT